MTTTLSTKHHMLRQLEFFTHISTLVMVLVLYLVKVVVGFKSRM